MFKKPFSFNGRIGRTEYGLSFLIYLILAIMFSTLEDSSGIMLIFYIPMLWFFYAQGAKRCHDLDNSGWFQIIPFYFLWMLFAPGKPYLNRFDEGYINSRTQRQPVSQSDILDSDIKI